VSDEPRGDFALDAEATKRMSRFSFGAMIAFALTFIVLGIVQIEPSAWWEWALIVVPFTLAVAPAGIMAASRLGRLRGNPVLVLSDDGIEVQRGGLWTLLPARDVPARDVIPWTRIRDVHEHAGGVVVDHEDYRRPLLRRVLGPSAPAGEVISVHPLEDGDRDPYKLLIQWNEARLVAAVRTDRLGSPPSEKVT